MKVSKSIAKKSPGPDPVTKEFCGTRHKYLEESIGEMRDNLKETHREFKTDLKEIKEAVKGNGKKGLTVRVSLIEQRTLLLSVLALTFIGVLVEQFLLK